MTASVGREVQSNRVSSVPTAQPSADAQDAGGQDLGDLVEPLGGGHQVGVKRLGHVTPSADASHLITYRPEPQTAGVARVKIINLHLL
jgi:hypothetical protein